jgi:hypothetical protein
MQESEVNFARIQNGSPSTSARTPMLGFQSASHDKRVSHGWSKTTYTEEAAACTDFADVDRVEGDSKSRGNRRGVQGLRD